MSNVVTLHRLCDGPLIAADQFRDERAAIVGAMAYVLIDNRACADQGDSIMALVADGRWSAAEVMMLQSDARRVANEHTCEMVAWS